ncbi:glycerol kinase GlpK [Sphingomonas aerophila]|uniref:glycerol kinase n=1 Tax=Sphingomonas aerophila TaxID=1344948 RepID=A0A7W9EW36_9SPHN|nr:glycerol kinase GlpK [Sphingomonas aerophila]MBB5715133.1 glycerol kinase [Sphingomonas aerophila]
MPSARHILSIDQGTTSTRALVFDQAGSLLATAQRELPQHYPADGWVEHDPEDIWRDTLAVMGEAARLADVPIAAIGITNQRETVVIWDRTTGRPIAPAIVWQDRRTAARCEALRQAGHEPLVQERTGLLLDPYFSATKLAWLLDHVPGARARAAAGELAAGTIDSFLTWRLTGGRVHATDATNASRTALFDIDRQRWCPDLLALFEVPAAILPEVRDSSGDFGWTDLLGGRIPIAGVAGDQQAALVGQGCFSAGEVKATYGTGCFALMNTGAQRLHSTKRLLSTVAYRLNGVPTYALEGSIFVAGAAVKWLRDGLGLITHASDTHDMATQVKDNGGVYLVPAFVGLGAPHWRPDARALLTGMTLATSAAHVARAAIEAVGFQTHDLLAAMADDGAGSPATLRVDGGMTANDWLCGFLADLNGVAVERPAMRECTALGAAFLAGLGVGLWPDLDALRAARPGVQLFAPTHGFDAPPLLDGWRHALRQALLA